MSGCPPVWTTAFTSSRILSPSHSIRLQSTASQSLGLSRLTARIGLVEQLPQWQTGGLALQGVVETIGRAHLGENTLVPAFPLSRWWYLPGSYLRQLVIPTGQGLPPAVGVLTGRTVLFSSGTVLTPDPLLLGGPNPVPYPSNRGFHHVWLDPSGPISGYAFGIFIFMVTFRYPTVNCKILTMVLHCHFLMYWQPSYCKQVERRSLPHPENECQWSVNNGWSCVLGNLSGTWSHVSMNNWLAAVMSK